MTAIRIIISSLFLLIITVTLVQGQENCDFDLDSVIERVTEACANVAPNEVCYGNRDVTAHPRVRTFTFDFDAPGDILDLTDLLSLEVDAFNATEDTWGVAQMRLQVGSNAGTQDVTMLLFGTFEIANAVEDTDEVILDVQANRLNIHSEPFATSEILVEASSGNQLAAVAKLADDSWLRVRTAPDGGTVGWILNSGVSITASETDTFEDLPIHEPDTPYFGAMQAFYFQSGNSNIGCDSLQSDGLLIQTPEGEARISLLINEVSIELLSRSSDSEEGGGTAIIQANPDSAQGMSVNVIEGEVTVQTAEGEQTVQQGQRSTIPIAVNFGAPNLSISPSGEASEPRDVDFSDVNLDPLLGAVANVANNSSGGGNQTVDVTNGGSDNTDNSNNNSNNNSDSGSGGFEFDFTGNGNNNNSSDNNASSSGNGDGSGNSTGTNPTGGSGTSDNNSDGNGGIFEGFSELTNTVLLWTAVISGIILLTGIIIITTRRNPTKDKK